MMMPSPTGEKLQQILNSGPLDANVKGPRSNSESNNFKMGGVGQGLTGFELNNQQQNMKTGPQSVGGKSAVSLGVS